MKKIIIGLGEILWDCLPEGKQLGGAPANFAFHAGQFGHEALTISAVGNDELGRKTIEALKAKRLRHLLPQVEKPTGTVLVSLDNNGVPAYEIREEAAWDYIPFTDMMKDLARKCDAVCFGSLAQRNEASRTTIHQFLECTSATCLKVFDINLRQSYYTKTLLAQSMMKCDILKINDEELERVFGLFDYKGYDVTEMCRFLIKLYRLKILVLTCGTDGSYVFTANEVSFLPTPKIAVTDTVGAGDSFSGAFIAAILSGKMIQEAHRLAVDVSAYVCSQRGAMPLLPEHFIKKANS